MFIPVAAIPFPAKLCHLKMGWNWLNSFFTITFEGIAVQLRAEVKVPHLL